MDNAKGANSLLDIRFVLDKAQIAEGMRVADLGCGSTGHFVLPAAHIVGPAGRAYAVDIMKPALENIRRRSRTENLDNLEPVWSDLEIFNAAAIESGSLDRAFLINTLYQSRQREAVIKEAVRLLKRGGLLLVVEWKNSAIPFGPPPAERVKEQALKDKAERFGLDLRAEFPAGRYHYGLIFEKI